MSPIRPVIAWLCMLASGVLIGYIPSPVAAQESSGARGHTAEESASPLPQDVYPDSRNRFPLIQRDDLDEPGKKAYDAAVGNIRSLAGLQGPAGIRLHSPRSRESEYLRYESDLGRRLTELAILVTAREMDQQFEWTVHEPEARKEGLEPEIIDIVKHRKPLTGLGEKEAILIQLGREVLGKHKASPDTFARALKLLGPKTLVDLVSLMGQYAGTAALLTAFDQQLPPGQKPLLPIP